MMSKPHNHINLWLDDGNVPTDSQNVEVIVTDADLPEPMRREPLLLEDDVWSSCSVDTVYKLYQNSNYWNVVGVRPPSGGDWDLKLYEDTLFQHELETSDLGGDVVDFVASDFNHLGLDNWEGVSVANNSGSGSYFVEYEDSPDILPSGSQEFTWSPYDVVEVWDVELAQGQSPEWIVDPRSGLDLGVALMKSDASDCYVARSDALALEDDYGPGGAETLRYDDIPEDDWYALVIWSNSENSVSIDYTIDYATGLAEGHQSGALTSALFLRSEGGTHVRRKVNLRYCVPSGKTGSLEIYDVRGRLTARLGNSVRGRGVLPWEGTDVRGSPVPSGVYYARLTDESGSVEEKLTLLR
jgi:hypothetical protein